MEIIETLLKNFIALDLNEVMNEFISNKKVEEFILNLEKDRLYIFGEDSKGKTLGQYAPPRSGHIRLFDTGEFYNSFSLRITEDGFILDADGKKESVNLFDKYGNDILGLSDEDFDKFIEYSIEGFRQIILSKLFEGVQPS